MPARTRASHPSISRKRIDVKLIADARGRRSTTRCANRSATANATSSSTPSDSVGAAILGTGLSVVGDDNDFLALAGRPLECIKVGRQQFVSDGERRVGVEALSARVETLP